MKIIEEVGVYFLILVIATFVAGLYGVLHDQISYTISNEYFTQLRFRQFRIPWAYENHRLGVAYVGVFSTWWMGLLAYSFLGLFGFMFKSPKLMAIYLGKSMLVVISVAFIAALVGLAYGYYHVNENTIAENIQTIPANVTNPVQFLRVAYMHSASYIGGIPGLIAGIVYLVIRKQHLNQSA